MAIVVGSALGTPTPARADAELSLEWSAASACPQGDSVLARVQTLLHRPLKAEAEHPLRAQASLRPTSAGGFTLRLRTRDAAGVEGVRELRGADCEALAEAAALVLALAVDPERVGSPAGAPNAPRPPPSDPMSHPSEVLGEPTRAPQPDPADPTTKASDGQSDWALRAGAGAGLRLDLGSLPGLAPGPLASLWLEWGPLRAELEGYWLPPRSTGGALPGEVDLFAFAMRGCGRLLPGKWSIWGCGGFEAGQIRGEGAPALNQREAGHRPWLAPLVGARLAWQAVGRLAVTAALHASFPLSRPRFQVEDGGEIRTLHRPAAVVGRGDFGIEVAF